ncbi:hypothetical protein N7462_008906 [Penicillium macrosclerotiorum]|uniref:uncharacterized protein n=1 Tax=Penicillium macrosclerotiorum TaxID=303699 RepID=UPI0025489477|nr:uncharacterized protein N7462_008906 [Penicillium macrosclerotiorum]KAJ5676009.1 hypothetical protein N7462_008906 [Penicillium macrosclerotiorum]
MPTVKPVLPPLKTPRTTSFPSELNDDCPSSVSDLIKQEEDSSAKSTPLTPQSAIPNSYLKFLEDYNSLSPKNSAASPTSQPGSARSSTFSSQPGSALSSTFSFGDFARSPTVSLPPPTPASAGPSRRSFQIPRRLRIPQSFKYSSPTTDSPKSATSLRTPFSPSHDWRIRYLDPPRSATGKPVSVKQVVTRTVTYKRTHLEAPPKGKRRKCREIRESKELQDEKEHRDSKEHKEADEL